MLGRVPTVFISSTFYDLRQVRADLVDFVQDQLGYRFLASEFHTFPIDPSLTTIENCRRHVASEADLLVLIVGARYGTVPTDATKSVTNIEYVTARANNIPVYAFIARDVLAILPVFVSNPDADYSRVVDSPKLLSFVQELRGASGVWTHSFDLAQDIISTLRTQFAYAMSRGLALSRRANSLSPVLRELSGEAFRLVVERPIGWEPLLFVEVLQVEVDDLRELRRNHDLGLALGALQRLHDDAVIGWVTSMTQEAIRLLESMEKVAASSLNTALSAGDAEPIIYGARQLGKVYAAALSWAERVRRAYVPDDWIVIQNTLSALLDDFFKEWDAFLPRLRNQIAEALDSDREGPIYLNFTFTARAPNTTRLVELLHELMRRRGISVQDE